MISFSTVIIEPMLSSDSIGHALPLIRDNEDENCLVYDYLDSSIKYTTKIDLDDSDINNLYFNSMFINVYNDKN